MALADDVRRIGADAVASLAHVLDYYYQSRHIWKQIGDDINYGRRFTVRNPAKGTTADQAAILPRIPAYIDDYLTPAVFEQLVTIFEAFFFDLLARWLTAHPGSLYRKTVEVEAVLTTDRDTFLQGVIGRELNDVKYRRVTEWVEYLRKLVKVAVVTDDEAAQLAEIKASRDILVHSQSVVNAVYLAKAGPRARYAIGDILELPEPYFRASSDLIEKLTADVSAAVATRA